MSLLKVKVFLFVLTEGINSAFIVDSRSESVIIVVVIIDFFSGGNPPE